MNAMTIMARARYRVNKTNLNKAALSPRKAPRDSVAKMHRTIDTAHAKNRSFTFSLTFLSMALAIAHGVISASCAPPEFDPPGHKSSRRWFPASAWRKPQKLTKPKEMTLTHT